jgi:hypothetical protein
VVELYGVERAESQPVPWSATGSTHVVVVASAAATLDVEVAADGATDRSYVLDWAVLGEPATAAHVRCSGSRPFSGSRVSIGGIPAPASLLVALSDRDGGSAFERVDVPTPTSRVRVAFKALDAPATLLGAVTDGDGVPFARQSVAVTLRYDDAAIEAHAAQGLVTGTPSIATTDDEGRFVVPILSRRSGRVMIAPGSDRASDLPDSVNAHDATGVAFWPAAPGSQTVAKPLQLRLLPIAAGTVFDVEGLCVPGARIRWFRGDEAPSALSDRGVPSTSDAAGRFRLYAPRGASASAFVVADLDGRAWAGPESFTPGATDLRLMLQPSCSMVGQVGGLSEAMRSITGVRLTLPAGAPTAGHEASFRRVDGEGRFEFRGLPRREYMLQLYIANRLIWTSTCLWAPSSVRAMGLDLGPIFDASALELRTVRVLRSDGTPTNAIVRAMPAEGGPDAFMPVRNGVATFVAFPGESMRYVGRGRNEDGSETVSAARAVDLIVE